MVLDLKRIGKLLERIGLKLEKSKPAAGKAAKKSPKKKHKHR